MCQYIFAVLPSEARLERLRPVIDTFGMGFRPAIQEEFTGVSGEIYYATTRFCDCGTVLGRDLGSYDRTGRGIMNPEEIRKLRHKGWSETKIARWQADRERTIEKWQQPARKELQTWLAFLPSLLHTSATPWLGLFHHDYSASQQVRIAQTLTVPVETITAEGLTQMPEDVLYRFVSSPSVGNKPTDNNLCGRG